MDSQTTKEQSKEPWIGALIIVICFSIYLIYHNTHTQSAKQAQCISSATNLASQFLNTGDPNEPVTPIARQSILQTETQSIATCKQQYPN